MNEVNQKLTQSESTIPPKPVRNYLYSTKPSTINFEVLGNFTNKPLEGELADQEFSRLLVTTNFTKGDSARPVAMGLLDAS